MAFEGKYLQEGVELFDNQKHNVKELVTRRRALLSDRVGSGKTLSCLYSFAYLKEKGKVNRMVVLTPLSAYEKAVWKKDADKFTKLSCITLDDAKGADLMNYDIIFGKHTHVKGDRKKELDSLCSMADTLLVVDEVHAFKNPKAEISACMRDIARGAKNFWGITGSTISKNLEDLYNIVNLISPWFLGRFSDFREKWCDTREVKIGWNAQTRQPRTAIEIVGIHDEGAFKEKMAPLLITGESFLDVNFKWLDYELDDHSKKLYRKVAKGITLESNSDEEWLREVLSNEEDANVKPRMKDIDAFGSRFIYLQSIVDGVLKEDGTLTGEGGVKAEMCIETLKAITDKGQSCIIYFDFLSPLEMMKRRIEEAHLNCDVLLSTGGHVLRGDDVTEERCRKKPVVILGTRASCESASYYFINNVIFFNIPSVPRVFVQLVGRITRKNTLYKGDLNVYIFRSNNIDLYKMLVVSNKAYQMEMVQGEERNIPDDYKEMMKDISMKDVAKKTLLWCK